MPFYVNGIASSRVSRVRIELNAGEAVEVPTISHSAFSVRFYVAELPLGARPLAVVALGLGGEELERLDASASLDI